MQSGSQVQSLNYYIIGHNERDFLKTQFRGESQESVISTGNSYAHQRVKTTVLRYNF